MLSGISHIRFRKEGVKLLFSKGNNLAEGRFPTETLGNDIMDNNRNDAYFITAFYGFSLFLKKQLTISLKLAKIYVCRYVLSFPAALLRARRVKTAGIVKQISRRKYVVFICKFTT